MPRPFIALLAALALGSANMEAAASGPGTPIYKALALLEARVAGIGYRLTTANVEWCSARQPQPGLLFGDRRLYRQGQWASARIAYDAGDFDAPFVAAIVEDTPSARAGLTVGSPVAGVGTAQAAPSADPADDFARITEFERLIADHPLGLPLTLVGPHGEKTEFLPTSGCASSFRVEAKDRPAGAADGRLVLISAGLARFAADDDELAAAVAHELAHNILRHRERLDAAGVNRGLGKQFGRSARLFRQTEIEADRLSVWLLAGAGYDPDAAGRFWTRFGQREGRPLFQAGTHPRWRDRVALLDAEAMKIRDLRRSGTPLVPPLIAAPPPLE